MQGQYNMRNPAVKRLMKEAQELSEATEQYYAQPLEDNLFEWHFTIRGPADSSFEGGIYHGRIVLPPEYPMKPPSIILLTANGRFETFKKICLSISGHHPESWQPSWSIRTALLAIIGFMPTHGNGAIGSLDYSPEERKVLAKRSQDFSCSECGSIQGKLKPVTEASVAETKEAKELASQINFQAENKANNKDKSGDKDTTDGAKQDEATTSESEPAATSSQGADATAPPSFPAFTAAMGGVPPFPPGAFPMPPFMFPPGMRPPTSTVASNGAPSAFTMPPGFLPPPPFWPPMMPAPAGAPPGNNPAHTQAPAFPFSPFPFFSTPAAVLAARTSAPGVTSGSGSSPSAAASNTPSKTRATTTTVSSGSTRPVASSQVSSAKNPQPASASNTKEERRKEDGTTPSETSTASKPATSGATTSQAAGTPVSAAPAASTSQVRHRRENRQRRRDSPSAQAPSAPQRQSEHPAIVLLVVLLSLAILTLLVRRFYMMTSWKFDTDY